MKICLFTTRAQYPPCNFVIGGENQIPLKTAELLNKNQHEITFITSEAPPSYRLPSIVVNNLNVKTIVNEMEGGPPFKVKYSKVLKQIFELRRFIANSSFDIVHFFGANRAAFILGLLKYFGESSIKFMTFNKFHRQELKYKYLSVKLINNIDTILTLSQYTKQQLINVGIDREKIYVTRPGVHEKWYADNYKRLDFGTERFVLFWRDAEWENGADICGNVFEKLAPQYSNISFVFAIRPNHEYEAKLRNLTKKYDNIQLYIYPYDNFSITDLVRSAFLVVLPFRKLSLNPQIAVLETLVSGTPLITSSIESNKEIIKSGETGMLVTPTFNEVYIAIKNMLDNPYNAQRMGSQGKAYIKQNWNWDKYRKKLLSLYTNAKKSL